MRFSDIKIVESKVKARTSLSEASLMGTSKWLSSGDKSNSTNPTKYVIATAESIRKQKYFLYAEVGVPGKAIDAPEKSGMVDKITVNGKEMSTDDWEKYALANYPDFVNNSKFFIDGDEVPLNRLKKNEAVKGSLVPNLGDIAEAVLGAAISAKFALGGRNITTNDVIRVLKDVVAAGVAEGETDYQTVGVIEDNFKFTLTLNSASMKPLKIWIDDEDPMGAVGNLLLVTEYEVATTKLDDMQKQVKDAVEYANTNKRAATAVDKAKLELEGKNEIRIISDGGDAANQTSTKVDLKLEYDDQPQRLLSLKAGTVKQFGQVSGGEWETASDFFESIFKFRLPDTMKQEFGFKSSKEEDYKEHNYTQGPFAKLYSEMAKQVQAYTAGDDASKEYKLVQNVYDAINWHATRGEEGVTMVILSPSKKIAYKELAFDARLLSALELYDLRVTNDVGLSTHKISVIGELKGKEAVKTLGKDGAEKLNPKSVLVQLSTRTSAGAIRNVVEMGNLLKELANVEKLDAAQVQINKAAPTKTAEPEEAPVDQTKQVNDPNATV
jgi:hypothetical protein|tara:strand:- start:55 stop:1713 length:1659 start_codon:yes stop_codon:yes gene_type:complete